jgi:pyruvate-ferredoxin/flavodoxin oxidoreductase
VPYCVNKDGHGPTWGNSLFEDPAEFTYGMFLGACSSGASWPTAAKQAASNGASADVKEALGAGWPT